MLKVLFLSPHPDDVEIGCGGTISRLVAEGKECHIAVVVGPGDIKMSGSGSVVGFGKRKAEQEMSSKKLGIKQTHWMEIGPATQLDAIPISKLVGALDSLLVAEKFDAMFFPLPSHNQDHNYVWQAVMAATRPGRVDSMSLYAYEQPTQTHGQQLASQLPSRVYYKLTQKNIDAKEDALMCHRSQLSGRVHSLVGVGGVTLLAELRGLECGAEFAEVFQLMRAVR